LRRGRGLQPAASDPISLTIGSYHDAPLNARKLDINVGHMATNRNNILDTDPIYLYHPSPRQELQSPLALTPLSPAHSPVLIENQFLKGVHSAKYPNVNTYTIYMYLPHDIDHETAIHLILNNQLANMQSTGLPTSPEGLDALQVQEKSTYPVRQELDDEPITNTTEVISPQLRTCLYSFTITLPTFNSAAYGLPLLASRQVRWSTNVPATLIPQQIPQPTRQALLQQMPTTIRSNTEAPKLFRDTCSITNPTFNGHKPTECYRIFKASALHATLKLIASSEYRCQHERTTSAAELSPPLQALL